MGWRRELRLVRECRTLRVALEAEHAEFLRAEVEGARSFAAYLEVKYLAEEAAAVVVAQRDDIRLLVEACPSDPSGLLPSDPSIREDGK